MVLRFGLAVLAVLEVLVPRRLTDFWMRLAVTDDSNVELRPWVYTAARIEGIVILVWLLTRGNDG